MNISISFNPDNTNSFTMTYENDNTVFTLKGMVSVNQRTGNPYVTYDTQLTGSPSLWDVMEQSTQFIKGAYNLYKRHS